jgi:hypothetical protein
MEEKPKFYSAPDMPEVKLDEDGTEAAYTTGQRSAIFLTLGTLGIFFLPAIIAGLYNMSDRTEIQRAYGRGLLRGAFIGFLGALALGLALSIFTRLI